MALIIGSEGDKISKLCHNMISPDHVLFLKKRDKKQEMGAVAGHVVSGRCRIIPDLLRQIAHTAPE